MLARLVYYSHGTVTPEGLRSILESSWRNNAAVGLTGILFYVRPWFLQVLEGHREAVSRTFLRIARDGRHDAPVLMDFRAIDRRTFGSWTMCDVSGINLPRNFLINFGGSDRFDPSAMTAEAALALLADLASLQSKTQGDAHDRSAA